MCISCYQTISCASFSRLTRVRMDGLLKLLVFACCVITATAQCTLSKYNQGTKDRLNCFNSSIIEVQSKLHGNVIVLSVSLSVIPEIPNHVFIKNATAVEDLNFHQCGIERIGNEAFKGLGLLKKLSLPYNNITTLNASWFYDLPLLEKLDLSFNKINNLDSNIYFHLQKLQRLDLNYNLLNCIPKENMGSMMQLKDIRIENNPLRYVCRARLTLWLKDHHVSYATKDDNYIWLDGILWQCLLVVPTDPALKPEAVDEKMNICVMSNMFNQLSKVLDASTSKDSSIRECSGFRQQLTYCLRNHHVSTNGDMIMNYLGLTDKVSKVGAQ